jgi:sterol desaturase/sphingolipid hydroxylase (fatty acid hydroxylase superfamily)
MQIAMKDKVFNWIPPAMIVMALLFWSSGPAIVLNNPWTLTVVSSVITLLILGLERVHERHAGWRMNKQEFFTDLFYVILNSTVISWVANRLAEDPLTAAKASLGISTQWVMHMPWVVQAAMVLFLIEFGQYWMHRLMHNWHPFWLTHAPHHHITQLNAAKGAIGNPLELFLISLSVIALFDFDKTAMFAAFTAGSIISGFAHANVRSDPPRIYSFFFTTIRNHSLHHSVDYENTRCNYGNSLILLDRIFGTYREGEGVLVGQDERKRLSIKEQMLFPFQGPIDRFMAKRAKVQSGTELPEMAQGDSPARETVGGTATA